MNRFGRPIMAPAVHAPRDPISDIIGLTYLIGSVLGISTAAGGIASVIGGAALSVGLSIGLNYAAAALRKTGSEPLSTDAIDTQAVKLSERQAIPSKRIPYGYVQQGGALFFEAVKPPYLYQGLLLSAEQISAIQTLWIGTNQIPFGAPIAQNTILTPIGATGQPNYPGRLKASFRFGSASQAIDPLLAADFPNLDASFRQQGIATAVLRYHYGADYTEFTALWGQVQRPNPLFLVQGVAVPDPRNPAHILDWDPSDPDSVAAAKASWSFSNNAALVQAHYLTQRYGGRVLPSRIDWDRVAEAANFDDEPVYCTDGTWQPRYTIDGLVTLNQSPAPVLSDMLSANRGFVLQSAGKTWVSSSKPRQPVATIYDALLTGSLDYRADKPKRDLLNRVKVTFIAPDREYQEVDGPVLTRADLAAADQETLEATLTLPYTMDYRRAERLSKAYLENNRLGAQLILDCDVRLLAEASDELIGNAVTFDSVLFAQANGTYFVTDWKFGDSFATINLTLVEYDPSIETDWNAATDELPFTIAPLNVS